MAQDKLIPLFLKGQPVELAVSERDFFHAKVVRKGEHEMVTYAEAGYRLGDRYEDMSEYEGPRTRAAYEKAQEEKRAARAKPKATGGPVNASDAYIVGERGPETFSPKDQGEVRKAEDKK